MMGSSLAALGAAASEGPLPETPAERKALAVLYAALLTVECIDALADNRAWSAFDGTFLRDPLYATLVAALRPDAETVYNLDYLWHRFGRGATWRDTIRVRAPAPLSLSRPTAFAGDHKG